MCPPWLAEKPVERVHRNCDTVGLFWSVTTFRVTISQLSNVPISPQTLTPYVPGSVLVSDSAVIA